MAPQVFIIAFLSPLNITENQEPPRDEFHVEYVASSDNCLFIYIYAYSHLFTPPSIIHIIWVLIENGPESSVIDLGVDWEFNFFFFFFFFFSFILSFYSHIFHPLIFFTADVSPHFSTFFNALYFFLFLFDLFNIFFLSIFFLSYRLILASVLCITGLFVNVFFSLLFVWFRFLRDRLSSTIYYYNVCYICTKLG